MNKRTRNKIYNRATIILDKHRRKNDKRTYEEQIQENYSILSILEKRIFYKEQERFNRITDSIIEELKAEGNW